MSSPQDLPTHQESRSLWRRLRSPELERTETASAQVDRRTLSYSKPFWSLLLTIGVGVCGLGALGAAVEVEPVLLALAVVLGIPTTLLALPRLLRRAPAVTIDADGVHLPRLAAPVPWREIQGASTIDVPRGPDRVCLEVNTPWLRSQLNELGPLRRFGLAAFPHGSPAVIILPFALDEPAEELASWIDDRPYDHLAKLSATLQLHGWTDTHVNDPSPDELVALVLRLTEDDAGILYVTHQPSPGETWIEIEQRSGGAWRIAEFHRGKRAWGRRVPDLATASEQVVAWVRDKDAEAGR